MEILFAAVFLIASWHGMKHGVPRAMRAVGDRRRASVTRWRAKHPNAPKSARWAASVAYGVAALRWGPGYFKREFSQAFRDAWEEGKRKYRVERKAKPTPPAAPAAPSAPAASTAPAPAVPPQAPPPPSAPDPRPGRPHLRDVSLTQPNPTAPKSRRPTVAVEVVNPETLHTFLTQKVESAAAELEDAQADAKRAEAAVAEIEAAVASLTKLHLRADDVEQVSALMEPDQQWLAAARTRIAAADNRLASARKALEMAARHVQLASQGAAGAFYNQTG